MKVAARGVIPIVHHPNEQRQARKHEMALCPAVPSHTVPSSAVPTTPSHSLCVARLPSGAFHGASLRSRASVSVKVRSRTALVGSAHYGGVICSEGTPCSRPLRKQPRLDYLKLGRGGELERRLVARYGQRISPAIMLLGPTAHLACRLNGGVNRVSRSITGSAGTRAGRVDAKAWHPCLSSK